MTWLQGLRQPIALRLTPSQYLGAGLLALLLVVSAIFGQRHESQFTRTPVQEISATGNQSPVPATATDDQLPALLALNRQAAARVALVGLAGGEGREALARSAEDWMEQVVVAVPQTGDEFAARQRAILEQWRAALGEYAADGRVDSLAQVRAVSQVNAELYAEMMEMGIEIGREEGR